MLCLLKSFKARLPIGLVGCSQIVQCTAPVGAGVVTVVKLHFDTAPADLLLLGLRDLVRSPVPANLGR
ncbi:MAG TPA: hypothetical protein DG414_08420 [Gammaproteobacteria bacterium]|nr:hypothetical protein [Gammaproteobacteria bacterium]